MPSYLKSCVHNGEYSECGPSRNVVAFNKLALKLCLYGPNLEESLFFHCDI